jgi:hypothetical protein
MVSQIRQKARLPEGWDNCLNCSKSFKRRIAGKKQKFCQANCRKEFWKHGGVSVHRLKIHVLQWLREELAKIEKEKLKANA